MYRKQTRTETRNYPFIYTSLFHSFIHSLSRRLTCLFALSIILFFTSSQAPVKTESPPRGTTAQLEDGLKARHVTATDVRSTIRSTIFPRLMGVSSMNRSWRMGVKLLLSNANKVEGMRGGIGTRGRRTCGSWHVSERWRVTYVV